MKKEEIIKSIATRTGGDLYLGVVGAVRTGKSTFIKKVIETLVVPNIEDEYERKRALDEIPQSAAGKTIMTTEPKFVPSNAATIKIDGFDVSIRLIDCVGYVIKDSLGYETEDGPRMVKCPWYDEEIPFIEAAELGTEKVIKEHSSIGIVISTDGSFTEISRNSYEEAEERVVSELKEMGKPFIVILNSSHPFNKETEILAQSLRESYEVPVLPMNIESMNEKDIESILKEALYEFPILEVDVELPDWIYALSKNHWLKKIYTDYIRETVIEVDKLKDVEKITSSFKECEYISKAFVSDVKTETGIVTIRLESKEGLYDQVLTEMIGVNASSKAEMLKLFQDYKEIKEEYSQFKSALKMVKQTGYGIASPTLADMKLDTPEIIKQGSRYGVKLKATAPAIHMIRVDVESTFEPIIGSELQSKELINYLMKDYDESPENIWKSEIFGRRLDTIVKEGISAKLSLMPENIRFKLSQTLNKIVNKGSGNLIAFVL